jgi:hypothetical protein
MRSAESRSVQAQKRNNPPGLGAGRVPAEAGEVINLGGLILPEIGSLSQAGSSSFPQRRSYAGMRRVPATGLEPEGEAVPIVYHQHVLVLPRPRLRSCRRPFSPSPTPGPYRLPHAALERLQAALQPAKNREAALALAVFLARYWSAPSRLGQAFPIDRRALCDHRDLGLTEARVRGAVAALEEVGYLERIVPEPGKRYQRTVDGLHRQPLAFRFGGEFLALFEAANRRPRSGSGRAQDGRRPLPASPLHATARAPRWSSRPTG